ncbi:zinc-dependent alcohol dehydrogenase family protein [Croceicoccus bisphenolivorans]|uniref:zinc-dependent alcohol dehydrogenase family protein n=1 Tax=Croceicoccus bisphenolivorans TaxID=1783232 RepID=UPI00082FED5A|nr:NAD(P)-dependent alcohol dehydrogenase [Croceicoccus bisphenolivorans]
MIPATRKVVRLRENPTLETLIVTEEAMPLPGPGEVLMQVYASSLNFHDYLVAAGHIPQPAGRIPMSDGAGAIVSVGEGVSGLAIGDKVIGSFFPDWLDGHATRQNCAAVSGESIDGFGASHVVVPASSLVAMPEGWTFEEAATLPCAGLTAWRALVVEAELKAGDSILLPGSGGLAIFCHQLAEALGIRAFAISSGDAKLERLKALGADVLINYRTTPEWSVPVVAATDGEGVDAVLEIGGAATFEQSVAAVRNQGRVIVVGTTANDVPPVPHRDLIMRSLRLQGMAVGSVAHLRDYIDFVASHDLRPVIDASYPLERLGDAFAYQLRGEHFGKIVVTI